MIPKDDKYYYRTYYFLPVTALDKSFNKIKYRQWANQGFLTVTPQAATDYDYILKKLLEINRDIPITQIAYDPWNSRQFINDCQMEGFNMRPFTQTIGNFNRPTKEFARQMISGNIIMYPNPIDTWCFQNVGIKTDYNDNERVVKGGNENNKIDGVVASIVALGGYLEEAMPEDLTVVGLG